MAQPKLIGLEGDWEGVLRGRGCPEPKARIDPTPVQLYFEDEDIEERRRRPKNEKFGRK